MKRIAGIAILCGAIAAAGTWCVLADPVQRVRASMDRVLPAADVAAELAAIVDSIEPVQSSAKVRRNIAHATFCLPQNLLGILLHGFCQLTGTVRATASLNEATVVVTRLPLGVSLGKTILLHESLLTENLVRHEYGHVLQGYRHGPFYLLLEGSISFGQLILSLMSPAYAADYYHRWPESEANELGGVR